MRLSVKVVPGASRDGICGWLGETLKVRVTAAAEKGKANAAVEKLVATALTLPAADVSIIQGKASARKVMEITALDDAEVRSRLSKSWPRE